MRGSENVQFLHECHTACHNSKPWDLLWINLQKNASGKFRTYFLIRLKKFGQPQFLSPYICQFCWKIFLGCTWIILGCINLYLSRGYFWPEVGHLIRIYFTRNSLCLRRPIVLQCFIILQACWNVLTNLDLEFDTMSLNINKLAKFPSLSHMTQNCSKFPWRIKQVVIAIPHCHCHRYWLRWQVLVLNVSSAVVALYWWILFHPHWMLSLNHHPSGMLRDVR